MKLSMANRLALVAVLLVLGAASALAQQSDEELAKAVQNPIASLISLPVQSNNDFDKRVLEGPALPPSRRTTKTSAQ